MRLKRQTDGFVLFEAIIALALAALALSAVQQSVGSTLRAARLARVKAEALALVRTHIDSVGADGTVVPGQSTGTYANRLAWRLTVSAIAAADSDGRAPYWITLEALDPRGGSLVLLETARVARGLR